MKQQWLLEKHFLNSDYISVVLGRNVFAVRIIFGGTIFFYSMCDFDVYGMLPPVDMTGVCMIAVITGRSRTWRQLITHRPPSQLNMVTFTYKN